MRILVVGAGGYVGGRLVPRLLQAGHELALISRNAQLVAHRFPEAQSLAQSTLKPDVLAQLTAWADRIVVTPERIPRYGSSAWADELRNADGLGRAVASAMNEDGAARHILNLGELGDTPRGLAGSGPGERSEVCAALAAGGAPVLELRSSLIIGSGSAAFDMVRRLVDRFPVMTTPRWVDSPAQPIAIRDVLLYLVAALGSDRTGVIEIGGPEVLPFGEMLMRYADLRGLRRWRIRVPVTTPRLSDAWVSFVSPLPAGLARAMIDRLLNGVIVRDPVPAADFGVEPLGYREALRIALEKSTGNQVETTWFDAFESRRRGRGSDAHIDHPGLEPSPAVVQGMGRLLVDRRSIEIAATPERVFREVERVGGAAGWPAANVLWRLRGMADRLVGGVGMRLGRRDQERLRVGDALDFWRVEVVDRPRTLRLRAEMKVPGLAWLQYDVEPTDTGSRLVQTASFDPHGLAGLAYWYALLPVHDPIFRATVRVLARRTSTP